MTRAKETLSKIIKNVINEHPEMNVRVSFVGYRDISDAKRFEIIDFTNDIEKVQNFIGKLTATGGGDACEDITGGFDKALKLNWKAESRYAIQICDYPCHGAKYHNNCGDYYLKGCPKGLDIEK